MRGKKFIKLTVSWTAFTDAGSAAGMAINGLSRE